MKWKSCVKVSFYLIPMLESKKKIVSRIKHIYSIFLIIAKVLYSKILTVNNVFIKLSWNKNVPNLFIFSAILVYYIRINLNHNYVVPNKPIVGKCQWKISKRQKIVSSPRWAWTPDLVITYSKVRNKYHSDGINGKCIKNL